MAKKVFASGEGKIELSLDDGTTYLELKNTETVTLSSDNETADWTPFGNNGFKKNYVTGKSFTISIEKKLNMDEAIDKDLLKLAITGAAKDHNGHKAKFTFPLIDDSNTTPTSLEFEVSISFSDLVTGASTDVAPLKFDLLVSGEPLIVDEGA